MNALLLCLSMLCPPDAASLAAYVGVSVPPGIVVGEPTDLTAILLYFEKDPANGYNATSFSNGTITLTIEGNTINATPTDGVPIMGLPGCGGTNQLLVTVPYTFCTSNPQFITARYIGGQSSLGAVSASSSRSFFVGGNDRMRIERQEDTNRIWWYGEGSFSLEASTDLKEWREVAVITSDSCLHEFAEPAASAQRFYRYRRLP